MNRVTEALEGKVIFLTGVTGFLGQPLVEKILWLAPNVKKIYALIRSKRELDNRLVTAQRRLEREVFKSSVFERLLEYHGAETESFLRKKIIAISGDISNEKLGLTEDTYKELCEEVDIVISSGAVVSFDAPLDTAIEGNSLSAARMAEFANACKGALLVHVSTAYVAGTANKNVPETIFHQATKEELKTPFPHLKFSDVDHELELLRAKIRNLKIQAASQRRQKLNTGKKNKETLETLQGKWLQGRLVEEGMRWAQKRGWNDTYTYTKALGEQMLLQRRANDRPTVIIRPSVIEGSLAEPTPGWLDGLRMADPLIVAIGKGRLRTLPLDAGVALDLIPVDMVVNALLATIPRALKGRGLEVYQVATGDTNPVTLGELHDLVYDYFRKSPMLNKQGQPIVVKPLKFYSPAFFRIQYQLRRVPLRALELVLTKAPLFGATEKLKRKISAARMAYERLYYYGQIYEPYLNLDCRFEVKNTQRLFGSLSPAEKKSLNFDVSSLSWRHYMQDVHIPGIKKHILKIEGSSAFELSDLTINTLVQRAAAQFPNKTALQVKRGDIWRKFSYKELKATAEKISATLQQAELQKGDRVVLFSENKPEWGMAYLGAALMGAVVVPLDAQTWHKELWAVVRFTGARAIIASERCLSRLPRKSLEENDRLASPARLLNADGLCEPFVIEGLSRSIAPLKNVKSSKVVVEPDDLASIVFTNSTAVDPKGVIHTHRNFISNLLGVNSYLPASESDQLLSVLPLNHVLEFTCGLLMPLYAGATVTYLNSLKPRAILGAMKETGATCMLGVPTLYALIREDIERRSRKSLESAPLAATKQPSDPKGPHEFGDKVRFFVSGGSALGEELYESFQALGTSIYEGYGLTETAPVLTANPVGLSRKGSAGRPLPGVELKIASPNEEGIGEILAQSPSLMKGYYENPAATEKAIKGKWFYTGDLGRIDADGYLYVTGRKKDVIVTGAGKNVYPADLEAIYVDIPNIKEVCVVGLKSGLTEDVHAAIVPTAAAQSQAAPGEPERNLRQEINRVAKELPSYHRLQHTHFWMSALPRTSAGKLDREGVRRKLIRRLGQAKLSPKGPPAIKGAPQNQREAVLAELSRLSGVPAQEIGEDSHLYSDLGFDSLMAIELLLFVERAFEVSVPDQVATSLQTAGQVFDQAKRLASADGSAIARGEKRLSRGHTEYPAATNRYLLRASLMSLKVFYRAYFALRVRGIEHFPERGPYIIAANHSSHLDAAALLASLCVSLGPAKASQLHVLGAKDYFFDHRLKGWALSALLNVVPVDREDASLASLHMVKNILAQGAPVAIFPEGTRSRTGQIQEFKPGIGLIAVEAGVPIVPVYIKGAYQALPPGSVFPRPRPIEVFCGPKIDVDAAGSISQSPKDELYRQIAAKAYQAVTSLPQASIRG